MIVAIHKSILSALKKQVDFLLLASLLLQEQQVKVLQSL